MAAKKFGPHLKTILKGKHIDAIYEFWGAGGLSFPLPRLLLEVLAEIKMAFTQMAPNVFRYFLGFWVRAQDEGIPNKDDRWREKFFVFKINPASVGDFDFERIPREWSDDIEPFGSAPMSPELRGLMETLRRGSTRWLSYTPDRIQAAYALPPGANRATPIALMAPVRPKRGRGTKRKKDEEVLLDRPDETSEAGSSERTRKVHRGRVLRPRSQAQSPGLPERPVSVAIPSGGARKAPDTSASSAGDRALNDEVDSLSRQSRRRVLEEINSVTSGSSNPRLSLPLRASGEGTSRVNPGVLPSSVSKAFSWSFAYDSEIPILENPESLATLLCKIRAKGCELPSLEHLRERDAYVQMAVANAKAMEASNDFAALMVGGLTNFPSKEEIAGHLLTIQQLRGELDTVREAERQCEVDFQELRKKLAAAEAEKVIAQRDLNSMEEKYRREIEGQDRKARKDLHLARVSLAKEYEGGFDCSQGEGGFELEAELERLKDLEVLLDVDYGLASVSDLSLGRLDLPEIS
ncbi:hypothetical protein F2Q69_00044774 [Brassica cretica]|uniref:Uncharacterized protein n=1 Tax=Brassica cretica TaxID=69181 RepID=A0A8S9NDM0_BRACR|nr:hypothetical protein F2Q69_00044774 [Brassica cretica]